MAVSKRLRYEILRRDNHTCRYCGATAPDAPLRVDHVTPVALGGSDSPSNLVTSCEPCNSGKTSSTPDATLVADVSQDALRWATAMKQAAENLKEQQQPKLAYREAFTAAWKAWGYTHNGKRQTFELPDNWKSSIDTFREAGLPIEVWPDIVETAMTNPTVKADNAFRYCCGIAWRMIRELQEDAKRIVGATSAAPERNDSVVQAAVDVWVAEQQGDVDAGERSALHASAVTARERHEPHRVVQGAQYAAWFGWTDIAKAITALDEEDAQNAWNNAWLARTGEWPERKQIEDVNEQCEALLAAGVDVSRVVRAAAYAGARQSTRLYFGLADEELAATGEHPAVVRMIELWAEAFSVSADRQPTKTERSAFFASAARIGKDISGFWLADIYVAAVTAGAYQDPDLSSCLPRHLSALEAAAQPLQPLV